GDAVDVRRLVAHQAAAVGADVGYADVVAEDDEDVRLLAGLLVVLEGDELLAVGLAAAVALLAGRAWRHGRPCPEHRVQLARRCQVAAQRADEQRERDGQVLRTEHENYLRQVDWGEPRFEVQFVAALPTCRINDLTTHLYSRHE